MARLKLLARAACVVCAGVITTLWHAADRPTSQRTGDPRPEVAVAPELIPPVTAFAPSEVEDVPPLVRFGDSRLRHPAPVKSLALTYDGTRLLTATRAEPVLRLWDVRTGKLLRALRVEAESTSSVTVLAITPDARKAFIVRHQKPDSGSQNERWHEPLTIDLETGTVIRWPLLHGSEVPHTMFALSPDGKTLAEVIRGEVRAWEFATGAPRVLGTIDIWDDYIGHICFSPDGKQIAVCRGKAAFYVAPVDGSAPLRRVEVNCGKNDVRAVHWHAPNRIVARWHGGLIVHDPATGGELARFDVDLQTFLFCSAPTSGGNLLFAKTDTYGPIKAFDLTTLAAIPERAHDRSDRDEPFTVSADGRVLAVVSAHAVRLFDASSGKPLQPELESAPFEPLTRLHVVPGARLLGCTHHTAHAWDLSDAHELAKIDGRGWWSMTRFALSPDGRFAGGGRTKDGAPLVVEVSTGREIALPKGADDNEWNTLVGFAGNDRAWVWNRKAGARAEAFVPTELDTNRAGTAVQGFPGTVFVAVSPDGRKIAAAGWAGLAVRDLDADRGWEILDEYTERRNEKRCGHSPPPCGIPVRFSPCGKWLLVSDGMLEVWSLHKHPVRAGQFASPARGEWTWSDGAFSADGRYLAIAMRARDSASELCVWELATASEVYRFRPARGAAGCAFTPDGKRLIVAHNDTTLSVYDRAAIEARYIGAAPAGAEWDRLRSRSANEAHAAVRALVANPARAVGDLARRFDPPDPAVINRLLIELDDEDFRARERAQDALTELGAGAEPALRAAVRTSPSPEVRARAAALLKALGGEQLRAARAVEVLERINSPEAKALLAKWANTYSAGPIGSEARAALARLGK